MKSPAQIQLELSRCVGDIALQNCIREIQADALTEAALICENQRIGLAVSQTERLHNLGVNHCQTAIYNARAAAMPNRDSIA